MAAHPGELDTDYHPEGRIVNALEPAHVKKFPLTDKQAEAVFNLGGVVDDVSFGQKVIFQDGSKIVHGTKMGDGLHTGEVPEFA